MSDARTESELWHDHALLLTRPIVSLMLDEAALMIERFDGDYPMALLDMALIQATRPTGDPEADSRRTISVRALAASIEFSYETCRRKVRELEAAGRCVRVSANRLKVAPGLLETPEYEAECEERWRNLRTYLVELREIGFDYDLFSHVGAQSSVKAPTQNRMIAALIDDFILRLGEGPTRRDEDFLNTVIVAALMNMNGAPIRRDPELTWKYASEDTPPPDSLREPVTITMLARRLALSEDVVGRRLKLYLQAGHVQRVRGGYLFVMSRQLSPEVQLSRKAINERFFHLVQALRQMGIDPATVTLD